MKISDEMWKEVGYVSSPTYRTRVMKSLEGEVKIPKEIAKDSDIIQNHISTTLRQLKEHNLVDVLILKLEKVDYID